MSKTSLSGLHGHVVCKNPIKPKFQMQNEFFSHECVSLLHLGHNGTKILLVASLKLRSSQASSISFAYSGNPMTGNTK